MISVIIIIYFIITMRVYWCVYVRDHEAHNETTRREVPEENLDSFLSEQVFPSDTIIFFRNTTINQCTRCALAVANQTRSRAMFFFSV